MYDVYDPIRFYTVSEFGILFYLNPVSESSKILYCIRIQYPDPVIFDSGSESTFT